MPYIALYFKAVYKYCRLIIFEKCVVNSNFLLDFNNTWISITLVKICFSHIFSTMRKNTFELVGTVLKEKQLHLPLPRNNANSYTYHISRNRLKMKTLKGNICQMSKLVKGSF